jgi:hypothetical protein
MYTSKVQAWYFPALQHAGYLAFSCILVMTIKLILGILISLE